MAYRGYRVVVFTPAGRKRVMSILVDNLSRFTNIVDEYQVWVNADEEQVEDIKWLESLPEKYDWIKLYHLKGERLKPKQMNTGRFYPNTIDDKTIYIRLDDDIVYIDDNFFTNLLDFRIDNPDYFLVMSNIWNNAILSWIHQQLGHIPPEPKIETAWCMDAVAWRSGQFAVDIHNLLIEKIENGTTHELYFDRADLTDYKRFSISSFCFFGKDFKKFKGIVGYREGKLVYDEEVWLTEVYPILEDKLNTICGTAIVAHYSFFSQRPYLDKTDILEKYRKLGKQKLEDSYYDILGSEDDTNPQNLDLKTIELPKTIIEETDVALAMKARKKGYIIDMKSDRTSIFKDDKQIGTILGKPNGLKIDRMLARLYRRYE